MTDDAYIKPSERERMRLVSPLLPPPGDSEMRKALKSHAVVDSVAADLATALRIEVDSYCDCDMYDGHVCQSHEALARYDALKGTQ